MGEFKTVTQEGVVKSQPGVCVSFSTPHYGDRKVVLSVTRHYQHLPNEFGGHGVIKYLDHNGIKFDTIEQAKTFALEHGYLREYFTAKNLRNKLVAEGFNPKTRMFEGPNPPKWWIDNGCTPLRGPSF